MSSPRQLAYRDRFVWHLEQVVSSIFDNCDDFTDRYVFPDMDTRVPLVILLSQREWTTLYSAILTGADLSYPDTSHDVEYLFLQTVICSMNEFCAAMINCINNDPDVLAALQALLAGAGLTGGVGDANQPMEATILEGNLLPVGYTCTDDKAFGMALAVVNSINEATTEVLQAIEILTNPLEIANELGDNVPGLGALTSAGDMAAWVQNSAHEAYNLAWSVTIRDELACLIWCEFKWDCELSVDIIWDIYLTQAVVTPPSGESLDEWVVWLIGLPLPGAMGTVARVSLLGLLAIRYGGSFGEFSLGIQSLETVMKLAEDDSSSDWSTVCDPCVPAWCYNFDFLTTDGGWLNGAAYGRPFGFWTTGIGWQSEWGFVSPGNDERLYMQRTFTQSTGTSIDMRFYATGTGGAGRNANVQALLLGSLVASETLVAYDTDGSEQAVLLVFASDFDEIRFTLVGNAPSDESLEIVVTSAIVRGTGSNPFGADNC